MHPHRGDLIGIGAMLVAMIGFVSNDTQVKLASETLPLGEVMFLRGAVTVALVGVLVFATGAHRATFRALGNAAVWWRTAGEAAGAGLFLTALTHLPLPTGTIIMQAVPLVLVAASAAFLGEVVHWRRWLAIAVGFAGVVVVMRPGLDGFNVYSLMALAAALFVALRDLSTRSIPRTIPTVLVVAVACVVVMLVGGGMGVAGGEDWRMPDWREAAIILGAGCCLIVGYWFVIVSMRSGAASLSAPFRYSIVLWATLYGYLIWDDRPDLLTWIGTGLIIGAGVYTFHRERLLARRAAARYDAASNIPAGTGQGRG